MQYLDIQPEQLMAPRAFYYEVGGLCAQLADGAAVFQLHICNVCKAAVAVRAFQLGHSFSVVCQFRLLFYAVNSNS